jgi:formate dehydrogenase
MNQPLARRQPRSTQKGRQVDAAALDDVRALLGDQELRRDLLIEYLHLLQDRFGHINAAHLAALAAEMRLSQAEVYEVATFYAHFDVVKEGEPAPPPITIRVCENLSCAMAGSEKLIAELEAGAGDRVRVVRAPCMGACATAPAASIDRRRIPHATARTLLDAVAAAAATPPSALVDFEAYARDGGFSLLRACLDGGRKPDDIIAVLSDAGLRGMGGAGFPTGRKWSLVRAEPGPRLMAVNADEGEPGTFKDRYYLTRDPFRILEGLFIAAWAVEAGDVYLYLRDEYADLLPMLEDAARQIADAGLSPHARLHLRRGAGAYICGEESAMLESIEGKRGLPRHRPPYVAQKGLFGRPTLVQNVETLYWVRGILDKGAAWFASHGRRGHGGLRSFSVSGRVKTPGVKLAPAGITARELIDEFCGGMADGHRFKGYLPGGASGGILPASLADIPLDFGMLEPHGCFVGSHALMVLSDKDDTKAVALNLMRFFAEESCGQCTPCRVGTAKAARLMSEGPWNEALLTELSDAMRDASICGLGQAASNPVMSVLRHFRDDLLQPMGRWT